MELYLEYEKYTKYLLAITEQIQIESESKESIAKAERNTVSSVENQYNSVLKELNQALKMVRAQYQSVWESCTSNLGIKRPPDQRPLHTNLSWKEAVKIQEQEAAVIRSWFTKKSEEALLEHKKRVLEEKRKKIASETAQFEAEKKQREEEMQLEKRRAEELVERLKQKYK